MNGLPNPISKDLGKRILALKTRIIAKFTANDWGEVGLLTGYTELIRGHSRLLRSLGFGDEDYAGHVQDVLLQIATHDLPVVAQFEEFLDEKYPEDSQFVSARPSPRKITFAPTVFEVPTNIAVEPDLAALMMPFGAEFRPIHAAIKAACEASGFRCMRADDLWDHSTIIQDVFTLLFRAGLVIVDFSGRNPNVMYETGIAHTLGKLVIPISQSAGDVPFDLKHHRVLVYLSNNEGLEALKLGLQRKLAHVSR